MIPVILGESCKADETMKLCGTSKKNQIFYSIFNISMLSLTIRLRAFINIGEDYVETLFYLLLVSI